MVGGFAADGATVGERKPRRVANAASCDADSGRSDVPQFAGRQDRTGLAQRFHRGVLLSEFAPPPPAGATTSWAVSGCRDDPEHHDAAVGAGGRAAGNSVVRDAAGADDHRVRVYPVPLGVVGNDVRRHVQLLRHRRLDDLPPSATMGCDGPVCPRQAVQCNLAAAYLRASPLSFAPCDWRGDRPLYVLDRSEPSMSRPDCWRTSCLPMPSADLPTSVPPLWDRSGHVPRLKQNWGVMDVGGKT